MKSSSVATALVLAVSSVDEARGIIIVWAVSASVDGSSIYLTEATVLLVAASCSAVMEDDGVAAVSIVAATSRAVSEDDGVAAVSIVAATSSTVVEDNDVATASVVAATFSAVVGDDSVSVVSIIAVACSAVDDVVRAESISASFSSGTVVEAVAVVSIMLELGVMSSLVDIGFLIEIEMFSRCRVDDTIDDEVVLLVLVLAPESDITSIFFGGLAFCGGVDTVVVVPVPEKCD
jgi:hypothetical protein